MKVVAGVFVMALFLWLTKAMMDVVTFQSIPAPIIVMIIFVGLFAVSLRLRALFEPAARFLIRYLQLFFVPVLVGAFAAMDVIRAAWLPLVFAIVASSIISVLAAGLCYRAMATKKGQTSDGSGDVA